MRNRNLIRTSATFISVVALLTLAVAGSAPANAKPPAKGTYTAKTENGGKFKFKLAGKKVTAIDGTLPVICIESTGSHQTRAGSELFQPPGSFTLGKNKKAKALQPAAMNGGTDATKNYDVLIKGSGAKLKGRVKLNYSFLTLGPDIYSSYIWLCSSSVSLIAKKG